MNYNNSLAKKITFNIIINKHNINKKKKYNKKIDIHFNIRNFFKQRMKIYEKIAEDILNIV